jgi:hypothetical protein
MPLANMRRKRRNRKRKSGAANGLYFRVGRKDEIKVETLPEIGGDPR